MKALVCAALRFTVWSIMRGETIHLCCDFCTLEPTLTLECLAPSYEKPVAAHLSDIDSIQEIEPKVGDGRSFATLWYLLMHA